MSFVRTTFLRHCLAAAIGATAIASAAPAFADAASQPAVADAPAKGVIHVVSNYGFDETVSRLKDDIAGKGIMFFDAIDHQALGKGAGLDIRRSTLLLFGNPPLGVQFLEANPLAGLDWPVRMLVTEDADGKVHIAWSDFAFIADRYAIGNRGAQFKMAGEVAASIASAAQR